MEEVRFKVEAVTPIFIAGADQRNIENEGLRPPSIKGLLRWWFRAALGGAKLSLGYLNPRQVKEEEEKLLGSQSIKGKVALVTFPLDIQVRRGFIRKRGLAYLTYGVEDRPYIETGSKFRITVRFMPMVHDNEKRRVIAALWLLLNLGNVGSKNRKGFGSLRVVGEANVYNIEFRNPCNINELEKYLRENVRKCLEAFGWNRKALQGAKPPDFPVIACDYWKMKILNKNFSSWDDAIDHIGCLIRAYREDRKNPRARHTRVVKGKGISYYVTRDYNAVKGIYQGGQCSTPRGSIFGLPHHFQFQSMGGRKAVVKGAVHSRRASPLYVKIWKVGSGKFVVGVQLFKSMFLPEDKLQILDLKSKKSKLVSLPDYKYLENFLNGLDGRWLML